MDPLFKEPATELGSLFFCGILLRVGLIKHDKIYNISRLSEFKGGFDFLSDMSEVSEIVALTSSIFF